MDEIVLLGDVHVYYPVNLEFHRQIAQMAGNKRLGLIYQSFVRELHIQRYRALSSPDVLRISNSRASCDRRCARAARSGPALVAARTHILNGIVRTRKAGQPGDDGKGAPTRGKLGRRPAEGIIRD